MRTVPVLRQVLVLGIVLAGVWGAVRAFMPSHAHSHGHHATGATAPSHPIGGMPLGDMPEMWLAGALLVALLAVMLLAPRRTTGPAREPRRGVGTRAQVVALTAALAIDVSKTSTLGFVIPGMSVEYGLAPERASLLAVAGLTGTTVGALGVRMLSDRMRRQDVYLLAVLGFVVTSSCGMMPTFRSNLVMCFLMGITVGGLAPLLVAALRDAAPPGRGASTAVTASVVATAVGFLVAAGSAAALEPVFGWRIMWIIGVPTGLALALLAPLTAESVARRERVSAQPTHVPAAPVVVRGAPPARVQFLFAFVTGLVGFGMTTWTPTLVQRAFDADAARWLLVAVAAVLAVVAGGFGLLARRTTPATVLAVTAGATGLALCVLSAAQLSLVPAVVGAIALVLTLFCVNATSAVFLPMAAHAVGRVGRTRFVAGVSTFNRFGGLCGPLLLSTLVGGDRIEVAICVMGVVCVAVAARVVRGSAPQPVVEPTASVPEPVR